MNKITPSRTQAKLALEVRRYKRRHERLAEAERDLRISRMWLSPEEQHQQKALDRLRAQDWSIR